MFRRGVLGQWVPGSTASERCATSPEITGDRSIFRFGRSCLPGLPYGPMKLMLFFLVALLLIGGGIKLAGQQIPILDYPLGGPMAQPRIEVQQPNMNLP